MLEPRPPRPMPSQQALFTFSSRAKTLFPLSVGPEPGPLGHQGKNMYPGASPSGPAIALDDSPFETQAAWARNPEKLGQPLTSSSLTHVLSMQAASCSPSLLLAPSLQRRRVASSWRFKED